jgi:hypothetical protein
MQEYQMVAAVHTSAGAKVCDVTLVQFDNHSGSLTSPKVSSAPKG